MGNAIGDYPEIHQGKGLTMPRPRLNLDHVDDLIADARAKLAGDADAFWGPVTCALVEARNEVATLRAKLHEITVIAVTEAPR